MNSTVLEPKKLRPEIIQRVEAMDDESLLVLHRVLLIVEKERLWRELAAEAEEDRVKIAPQLAERDVAVDRHPEPELDAAASQQVGPALRDGLLQLEGGDAADLQAARTRGEVDDYVDARLANFEVVLQKTLATVARGRARLAGRHEQDSLTAGAAGDDDDAEAADAAGAGAAE